MMHRSCLRPPPRSLRSFCSATLTPANPTAFPQISSPLLTQILFEGIPTYPDAGRWWELVDKYQARVQLGRVQALLEGCNLRMCLGRCCAFDAVNLQPSPRIVPRLQAAANLDAVSATVCTAPQPPPATARPTVAQPCVH